MRDLKLSLISGLLPGLLLFALLPNTATALTWTLQNVVFEDGGVAQGTFEYDATGVQSLTDFNITISGGNETTFPPLVITPAVFTSSIATTSTFRFSQNISSQDRLLFLQTLAPVTSAGGTFALDLSESHECYNCSPFRTLSSGSISAIPEPASGLLVALGLTGLAVFRPAGRVRH